MELHPRLQTVPAVSFKRLQHGSKREVGIVGQQSFQEPSFVWILNILHSVRSSSDLAIVVVMFRGLFSLLALALARVISVGAHHWRVGASSLGVFAVSSRHFRLRRRHLSRVHPLFVFPSSLKFSSKLFIFLP